MTTTTAATGILRDQFFTSPATGWDYDIDANGVASRLPDFDDSDCTGCECELDWNCGIHADRIYTPIERIMDEWAWRTQGPDEGF